MPISFNRAWQRKILTCLMFLSIFTGILGMYTLRVSPALSFDSDLSVSEEAIIAIEGVNVPSTFFYRLPAFFTPGEESGWWEMQERVYGVLEEKDSIKVDIIRKNGTMTEIKAAVGTSTFLDVFIKTGLIYLVGLVYIISAVSVFRRHRDEPGSILAFFLLFGSLYLMSSAPIVTRPITLTPSLFRILTDLNYVAAGGLIALVHFSVVFPEPKRIIRNHPVAPYVIFYGYVMVMTVLYLSGYIAYASSDPFLIMWTFTMLGALIHSIIKERDIFLRKQISLSLVAPLMVAVIFILFQILPGILGSTSMRFTYFALFSLIIPFALPSALDNYRLYKERIETEIESQKEKERIRRDLHDSIMNNLAVISVASEVSLNYLGKDGGVSRERLLSIKDMAVDTSRQIRGLLQVTDDRCTSWEEFCGHLRRYGYAMLKNLEIDFELNISDTMIKLNLPSMGIRACVYHVFREAMLNIIKHSRADEVNATFLSDGGGLLFEIKDNGRGLALDEIREGHYGIANMRKRIDEIGGSFTIESGRSQGTNILIQIPVGAWRAMPLPWNKLMI